MNINIKTTANKKSLRHLIYILCINTFVLIINMSKRAGSTLRPTWFDQHYMVGIVLFNFFTTLHKPKES